MRCVVARARENMLGDTLCSPCTGRHPRHEPATCSKYSNTYSSKETVKRGKVCHSLLEGELLTLYFSCFHHNSGPGSFTTVGQAVCASVRVSVAGIHAVAMFWKFGNMFLY